MIQRLFDCLLIGFCTVVNYIILGTLLTGFSCFRHGDVGPYPEVEYIPLLWIPAFLGACWMLKERR